MEHIWADTSNIILVELAEDLYNNSAEYIKRMRKAKFIYILNTTRTNKFEIYCTKYITEYNGLSPITSINEFIIQLKRDIELNNILNYYADTSLNESYLIIHLYKLLNENKLLNYNIKSMFTDAIERIKYKRHLKNNKSDLDYFFPK